MEVRNRFYRIVFTLFCLIGLPINVFALTERINVDTNGVQTNYSSTPNAITPDGRFALFSSYSDNLVLLDTNGQNDVFVRDLFSGTTIRVSVSASGDELNNVSDIQYTNANTLNITPDGRYVMFTSTSDKIGRAHV